MCACLHTTHVICVLPERLILVRELHSLCDRLAELSGIGHAFHVLLQFAHGPVCDDRLRVWMVVLDGGFGFGQKTSNIPLLLVDLSE